ncbi:GNAT family N-acetyltransferase [Archaeoglobales archaeon]|nr:MAG: GNAT family N-acetyltransferase [Archaeoglobales archaeon]
MVFLACRSKTAYKDFKEVTITDRKGNLILIRPYNHERDKVKLIDMYATFSPDNRCLGLPPTTTTAIENWIEFLVNHGFNVVAEHDRRIVGHLVIVPTKDCKKVDLTIFIHQDYQNRGIGQEMMKIIIDYCRKKGFEGVMLVTERTNSRAIHVYKKLGFQVVDPYYEYDMYLPLN